MSEKRIAIPIIKQAKIIRALLEYLSLKNKVLATSVSGSSITIPNGNLYHSFIFNMGGIGVPVYRTGDTVMYGLSGNNNSTTHVTRAIRCEAMTVSGNDLIVGKFQSNYMWHEGAKHGTPTAVTVSQIIGVEPKLPESLQEFVNSIGGGYCLSRLLGGGVGYALIHLAERHYPLYPFGKEFTYRWKHARRWIHSFPKWIQDVLGDRKQFKGSKHSDLADIIFRWICVSVSKLQYRDNNAVLLFCSFNTRRKHIQGVQLQHSKQSTKHCNKFKHWISGSRILIPGGDSYAAI